RRPGSSRSSLAARRVSSSERPLAPRASASVAEVPGPTGGEATVTGGAIAAPEPGSAEAWALEYVSSTSLVHKLAPPPAPDTFERSPVPRCVPARGRPPELRRARRGLEVPVDLRPANARAKLLHTFFHHELQAAELMCWAFLRFADAEPAFRAGLLRIC